MSQMRRVPRTDDPPPDQELLTILLAIEKINPALVEAWVINFLSNMERKKYLALVQLTETQRHTKGL